MHVLILTFAAVAGLLSLSASAQTAEQTLTALKADAKGADPAFKDFSATAGKRFFDQKHGGDRSCSSCHTDNPAVSGKHAKTGKIIKPLAPAANADRFTDPKKIAKWFRRNCHDVLARECTPQEKGDVLAYLLTVKP
jgi:mono/diheme cytochrome c family protein